MSGAPHDAQAWLDGRLTPDESRRFEAHLSGCGDCRALVERWRSFESAYQQQVAAPAPDDTDVRKLMGRIQARPAQTRLSWRPPLALGAAVAVAVAFFVLRPSPPPSEPAPLPVAISSDDGAPLADEVEAPAERRLAFRVGGDRIGLAPKSKVKVARHDRKQVLLSLERGSVAAAVTPREAGQTFVVQSREFEVTVVGTKFRVAREGAGMRVEVAEGHVRVASQQTGTHDVRAGHAFVFEGGRVEVVPFDLGRPDFAELSPDAVAEASDAGVTDEPEPEAEDVTPRGPSAAELERWRRAAVSGQCASVLPELHRRVKELPRQAKVWRALADCSRLEGKDRDAAAAYRRVAELGRGEDVDRAQLLLADLLREKLSEHREAEQVLRTYLKRKHAAPLEAGARISLARALIAQGKSAAARDELERVVKELPSSPQALEALELKKTIK